MKTTDKRKLRNFYSAMDSLIDHTSEVMPARQILAFIAVAAIEADHGYAEVKDVAEQIGAPSGVTSRDLLGLGKRARSGKAGLDLIAVKEDYTDLRRRPYHLTKKGHVALDAILEAL